MAWVGEPFAHDIFVSYSHGEEGIKEWSQAFVRELERELKITLRIHERSGEGTRELKLFLDEHPERGQGVRPTSALTDQLSRNVQDAALLAVLMCPYYLDSIWCRDERDWWIRRQDELKLAVDGCAFVVRILPTDESQWPDCFLDRRGHAQLGFFFYDRSLSEAAARPYHWPIPLPSSAGDFRQELVRLSAELWEKLNDVRRRISERRTAAEQIARLAADRGQLLYLYGREESAREWEAACQALSDSGFDVCPSKPETVEHTPEEIERIRKRRVETLAECDAALLLAAPDGPTVDADLAVMYRARRAARERSHRLLPCALLDNVGDLIEAQKQTARRYRWACIDATRDPWTPAVRQWLGDVAEAHT